MKTFILLALRRAGLAWVATIGMAGVLRANGVVFEGHGIPPHVLSAPTLNDLRAGRDGALELAQDWIRSDRPIPDRIQPLHE